eukprot:GHVU01024413.1.p2 GENE.GHVU01024413.1~~GHVU01024413.1.p2  ORF type:complete len:183 (+),score=18.30 GHVU01024413.1:1291-1839(+)
MILIIESLKGFRFRRRPAKVPSLSPLPCLPFDDLQLDAASLAASTEAVLPTRSPPLALKPKTAGTKEAFSHGILRHLYERTAAFGKLCPRNAHTRWPLPPLAALNTRCAAATAATVEQAEMMSGPSHRMGRRSRSHSFMHPSPLAIPFGTYIIIYKYNNNKDKFGTCIINQQRGQFMPSSRE